MDEDFKRQAPPESFTASSKDLYRAAETVREAECTAPQDGARRNRD